MLKEATLKPLQFSSPTTLDEALALLAGGGGDIGLLAGGTDLIVQLRAGRRDFGHMVDIKKIPELNVLSHDPGEGLRLGAAVSCADLGAFAPAREHFPGLVEGAELIGSTQVQSRATVGGNLCNGSPAADSICALIVLQATCVVATGQGRREVAAADFMVGPGETALKPGELLVEIRVPQPAKGSADGYLRFTPRNEMDIAVASAAVSITLSDDGKSCSAARVAIGAVGPTPIFVEEAGAALAGTALEAEQLDSAARAASAAARPIDDLRGTAEYRVHMTGVLTRRAIKLAAGRARKES